MKRVTFPARISGVSPRPDGSARVDALVDTGMGPTRVCLDLPADELETLRAWLAALPDPRPARVRRDWPEWTRKPVVRIFA